MENEKLPARVDSGNSGGNSSRSNSKLNERQAPTRRVTFNDRNID